VQGNTNADPHKRCCVATWEGKMKDDASGKIATVTIDSLRKDLALDVLAETLREAFDRPAHFWPARVELRSAQMVVLLGDPMALTHLLSEMGLTRKCWTESYIVSFEDTRPFVDRWRSLSIWGWVASWRNGLDGPTAYGVVGEDAVRHPSE
jgi:hypothetical protein